MALESVMQNILIQEKGIKMNNNDELTVVAFTHDIVIIAETKN